jgi:hypothetical protein
MATIITISQASVAQFGRPVTFMLGVQNTGASAVTISSMAVSVATQTGSPAAAARVEQPTIKINGSAAIDASATKYIDFSGSFYGQVVTGIPSAANSNFTLTAAVTFTDGTTSFSSLFPVALANPVFGLNPGAPPNPTIVVPSLALSTPANSGLHLLGWV